MKQIKQILASSVLLLATTLPAYSTVDESAKIQQVNFTVQVSRQVERDNMQVTLYAQESGKTLKEISASVTNKINMAVDEAKKRNIQTGMTTRRTNNSQNVKYVIRNIISEKNGSGQKDVQLKKELIQAFQAIISDNADPSGWANLGLVGSQIAQKHPTFKSKNYGYAKLRSLLEALNLFDIEVRKTSNSKNPEALIRNKTLTKVKNAGL